MKEWLVIDKVGDLYFFDKMEHIGFHFGLKPSEVIGVFQYSLRHINKLSPSKNLYIQRLFNNPERAERDYTKIKYNWYAIKFIYPNILND